MTGSTHVDSTPPGVPPEIARAMRGNAPTAQQWEAITHPLSPCAIVAGAGSGKTAVMAARVVYLVLARLGRIDAGHGGALPSEMLCLTFTNKACEELAHRVRDAVSGLGLPEGEEPAVLTYHAFAARLLDDYGSRVGWEPGRMLLSEAHRWQLVASLLADRRFEHLEVRTLPHVVRYALELAGQCADHCREPEELVAHDRALLARLPAAKSKGDREAIRTALQRVELADLVAGYRDRKRLLGAIDYGDQISLALELVRRVPEIAEEFRARFPVVLLDEYQDTNIAQARLLLALCGRAHPAFAVGDPDQNIYAWRGASLRNLLRFSDEFGGGEDRGLYVNFRSGSRVLQVANRVIDAVPEERRAKGKILDPHPERGEGRVLAFVETDQIAEGRRIADLIVEERLRSGRRWSDFAVLCRKKRLFIPIYDALRERQIPAEVVDLGGLLAIPEIVDVVSWLRVLDDPGRNIALARILQGPRWRIGYRDLVALARWSSRNNRRLSAALPGEDEAPGDVAFALAEALDHLGDPEMTGLSEEARDRLAEFRALLGELRALTDAPLADLVEGVIERSGLRGEIEASAGDVASAARLNLAAFVELVSTFSPVEGEATLSTLVDYLDVAEESESADLEIAQPSEANTVKLLTIHKAKGLEWDVVFVAGMAEHARSGSSIFPDASRQPNPLTQPRTLPFELRGDADVLPRFEGSLDDFREALRQRGLEEERRLCYVALTRARELLVVSAAYWYEGPREPHHPGTFYREISEHPACAIVHEADCPTASPLVQARAERIGEWPPPARPPDADELFPEGWHAAAREALDDPKSVERRVEQTLSAGEREEFGRQLAADLQRAGLIESRAAAARHRAPAPTLSVSGVTDYLRCPKLFYWSHVRPLPRRPSVAARLGTEIHRWIETQSRGQKSLLEADELPDLSVEERLGEPGTVGRLRENFARSRFAAALPLYVERPFLLYIDGTVVGGRIDAIFADADGRWEIVDYKTGRVAPEDDDLADVQLDLYSLAAVEIWGKRPEDLTLTYFYVAENVEISHPARDPEAVRAFLRGALAGIAGSRFDPAPGAHCRWCDFLPFCPPGREHLAGSPPAAD